MVTARVLDSSAVLEWIATNPALQSLRSFTADAFVSMVN